MKTTIAYAGLFILIAFSCNIRDGQQGTADNRRPNILFVIADDQSFPHAGAYGSALFKTPAFDMVAERGILFTNAFVAAPQCSPSRAARIMTNSGGSDQSVFG